MPLLSRIKGFSVILLLLLLTTCSSDGTVEIELRNDVHLEDTSAGSFVNALRIDHNNDALSYIGKIREALKNSAIIEDEFQEGKDKLWVTQVACLEVAVMVVPLFTLRKVHQDIFGSSILIEPNGVLYERLIGEKARELAPNRKYEGSVVIRSKTDNARLILYGFGDYCKGMVIEYD